MEIFDMYQKLNEGINGVKDEVRDLTIKVKASNGVKAMVTENATSIKSLIGVTKDCRNVIDNHIDDIEKEKEILKKINEEDAGNKKFKMMRKSDKHKNLFITIMALIAVASLLVAILK